MAVPQQLQEEAEGAAGRGRGRQAGMLRRAGQPGGGASVSVEEVQAERLGGAGEPPEPLDAVAPQPERQPHGCANRRQRRQDRVDERTGERQHLADRPLPSRAGGAERAHRVLDAAMQRDRAPVAEGWVITTAGFTHSSPSRSSSSSRSAGEATVIGTNAAQ